MKLTSETFCPPGSKKIFTAVEGFKLCRLPVSFGIPANKRDLLEVWAMGARLELVCLVFGWRGLGHYEWAVIAGDGIRCEAYSDKGFGSPEAARAEGLAHLRQYLLSHDEEAVEAAGKETA